MTPKPKTLVSEVLRLERQRETTTHSRDPQISRKPLFVVIPSRGWISLQLRNLWEYRELLYFLIWRDVKVRYKQTVLGLLWAVLQPFMTMVVFTIFFGKLGQLPSEGVPYPLFIYAALLPWQLFTSSLTMAGNSLVNNQHLITKVYFPRLIVPLSAVFVGLVDFSVSFVIFLGMMVYYGIYPALGAAFAPLFVLLGVAAALAGGIWLAALNVHYRDVQHTFPFLTQFGFFITPVAYSSSLVPPHLKVFYSLNPMVGVVEGFRWALLGQTTKPDISILVSILVIGVVLVGGVIYFRRLETTFADVV